MHATPARPAAGALAAFDARWREIRPEALLRERGLARLR